ncbi:MAG: hypothetical protein ACK43M_14610 [Allorhizobium sp.]
MICATINQLGPFGLTLLIALMWNAAVIGCFGLMFFDIVNAPERPVLMTLVLATFAVALVCLGILVFAGVCQ